MEGTMAVSHRDCAPFLSATLFHTQSTKAALTGDLRKAIIEVLVGAGVERSVHTPLPRKLTAGGLDISWFSYEERRRPAWYLADEITDTHNHFVAVCRKDQLVAVSFSDAGARNSLVRAIAKADQTAFKNLTRLSLREIEASFVEAQIRTLWLGGVIAEDDT
jgi:hypothetical protein